LFIKETRVLQIWQITRHLNAALGCWFPGVTFFAGELLPKRLELLRELVPTADLVAVLLNPVKGDKAGLRSFKRVRLPQPAV